MKRLCNVPQGGFGLVDLNKENAEEGCRGAGTTGMSACEPIAIFNAITRRLALCHLDDPRRLDNRLAVVVGWVAGVGYHRIAGGLGRDTVIWLASDSDVEKTLRKDFEEIARQVKVKRAQDGCRPAAGIGEEGKLMSLDALKGYELDRVPEEWRYDNSKHKFLSKAEKASKGYIAYWTGLPGTPGGYLDGDEIRTFLMDNSVESAKK
jgi:hypothetical protein